MHRFLKNLFGTKAKTIRNRQPARVRLGLEALESRTLLAGSLTASLSLLDNILRVEGTYGDDQIHIYHQDGSIRIDGTDITVIEDEGQMDVPVVGRSLVLRIEVSALDGNDVVQMHDTLLTGESAVPMVIHGGMGNDSIQSGLGIDVVFGEAGHDTIRGGGANDFLYGGHNPAVVNLVSQFNLHVADQFPNWLGREEKWLMTPYFGQAEFFEYYITPDGSIYQYDGVKDLNDPLLITLDPSFYQDIRKLEGAEGLYHYDFYYGAGLRDEKYLMGTWEGAARWYFVTPDGGLHRLEESTSEYAQGTLISTMGFHYHADPRELASAVVPGPDDDVIDGQGADDFIDGGAGNDVLVGDAGHDTMFGGAGNDLAQGGSGRDSIMGGDGEDRLRGGANNDFIVGENDRDIIFGGAGNDTLIGCHYLVAAETGNAADNIYGGSGNDSLYGGDGADYLIGEGGTDYLKGDGGNDFLMGSMFGGGEEGFGNDTIAGGDGSDSLYGGDGNDELRGDQGNDSLHGGAGNDWMDGWTGNDEVRGLEGNDTLHGGTGDDWVDGWTGNDEVRGWEGNDTLHGGTGNDWVDGWTGNDEVRGWEGNDTLHGGTGNDWVDGWEGNDEVRGWEGNDTLHGGIGNDWMDGWQGNDEVRGWHGDDTLHGGIGDDWMDGWDGNDEVRGWEGRDTMHGGNGFDTLVADRGDETLSGGENVSIWVPDGDNVKGTNWCGPSAASRLLRSYQHGDANFAEVFLRTTLFQFGHPIDDIYSLVFALQLGTVPDHMINVMRDWRPETQIRRSAPANMDLILQLLGAGRPVIALVNSSGRLQANGRINDDGYTTGFGVVPKTLHYIVLNGFDMNARTVSYMDYDGVAKMYSFTEFMARWDYRTKGPTGAFLTGTLGCRERTIIW